MRSQTRLYFIVPHCNWKISRPVSSVCRLSVRCRLVVKLKISPHEPSSTLNHPASRSATPVTSLETLGGGLGNGAGALLILDWVPPLTSWPPVGLADI